MDVWIRACALPPLSTRAVISLSLSHSLSLALSGCLSITPSLSLSGKNPSRRRASRRGEESSRRGEEADSFFFFFFFRYSGGSRIFRKINQKKKKKKDIHPHLLPPPHWCGAAEEEKKTHGCASESAADTALRTLLMPRLWVSDRLQKRAWTRGAERRGAEGRGAAFSLISPLCGLQSAAELFLAPRCSGKGRSPWLLPSPPLPPFLPSSPLPSLLPFSPFSPSPAPSEERAAAGRQAVCGGERSPVDPCHVPVKRLS